MMKMLQNVCSCSLCRDSDVNCVRSAMQGVNVRGTMIAGQISLEC